MKPKRKGTAVARWAVMTIVAMRPALGLSARTRYTRSMSDTPTPIEPELLPEGARIDDDVTDHDKTPSGAELGAVGGAALGLLLGKRGGNGLLGAAVGGLLGALAGAVLGSMAEGASDALDEAVTKALEAEVDPPALPEPS